MPVDPAEHLLEPDEPAAAAGDVDLGDVAGDDDLASRSRCG